MVTDPLADLLTQIRNAVNAGKQEVLVPYSRIKKDVSDVFKKEGYIRETEVVEKDKKKSIKVFLKTGGKVKTIAGIRRISRPGQRRFVGCQDIPRVLGGMGVAVLSTPQGVMSGHEARKNKVGGELICFIW